MEILPQKMARGIRHACYMRSSRRDPYRPHTLFCGGAGGPGAVVGLLVVDIELGQERACGGGVPDDPSRGLFGLVFVF